MTGPPDEDLVPVSVRLGEVVPPEDPEDWTRPLTWVAALGMLAGPLLAFGWFLIARPDAADAPWPATYAVAAILGSGAAVTGGTQIGVARAWTATLGAGLFGALAVVVAGVVMAGERQVGAASPTLAHAFAAAVAGLAGAAVAALVAAAVARRFGRPVRALVAAAAAAVIAVVVVGILLAG